MSVASGSSTMERDLRLDFFRGLVLFCMFIDHIPNNIVVRFNWTLHGFYDPIPVLLSDKPLWLFLSKTDLGLLRFANVLAIALLVARLVYPQARFLASRAARPFVICGRNSLHIFCPRHPALGVGASGAR